MVRELGYMIQGLTIFIDILEMFTEYIYVKIFGSNIDVE